MTDDQCIAALIRSNDMLRAAVTMAGKELAKREMTGKRHRKMLELMRDALREGRAAAKAAKGASR